MMFDFRYYIDILNEDTPQETVTKLSQEYPDTGFDPLVEYSWAVDNLKVKNRIDWFVTVLKSMFIKHKHDQEQELTKKEIKQLDKIQTILGNWRLGTPDDNVGMSTLNGFKDQLLHFYGFPSDKIHRYTFQFNQPINTAFKELRELEEEYLNLQDKTAGAELLPGDYWLMKFSDGMTWYYLDRGYCEQEGRLGKHCGNIAGKQLEYERLLSLRNSDNQVQMTFSLDPRDDNNILGEMKSKGNTHPDSKFFPYIMALLLYPSPLPPQYDRLKVKYNHNAQLFDIKGFDNRRRIPGIDFSVFDLDSRDQNYIDAVKPGLIRSQINISPVDILSADKKLQAKYKDELPEPMQAIIKDPRDVHNWIKAVDWDDSLIIYIPQELWSKYPDYEDKLVNTIIEYQSEHDNKEYLLFRAPRIISKNFKIVKRLVTQFANIIIQVSPTIKNYEELCKIAVTDKPRLLFYFDKDHRTYDVCKIAVSKIGNTLEFVPDTLSGYGELAKIAISKDPTALYYVKEEHITPELCEIAVTQDPVMVRYIPKNISTYKKLAKDAVMKNTKIFQYITKEARTPELCAVAVNDDPDLIRYVPNTVANYQELATMAVTKSPYLIGNISNTISNYLKLCEYAFKTDILSFDSIREEFRSQAVYNLYVKYGGDIYDVPMENRTSELYTIAVATTPSLIRAVPTNIDDYENIVKTALKRVTDGPSALLNYMPAKSLNPALLQIAIEHDANTARYIPGTWPIERQIPLFQKAVKLGYPIDQVPDDVKGLITGTTNESLIRILELAGL